MSILASFMISYCCIFHTSKHLGLLGVWEGSLLRSSYFIVFFSVISWYSSVLTLFLRVLTCLLQLGLGQSIYPQRPGAPECDVCITFFTYFLMILCPKCNFCICCFVQGYMHLFLMTSGLSSDR